MTIESALQEVYPDRRLWGTRRLGEKYVLSEGMRDYMITHRLTGKFICTWDHEGILYATTDGLTPYEKRLVSRVLRMWRGTGPIVWPLFDNHAKRVKAEGGMQAFVSVS